MFALSYADRGRRMEPQTNTTAATIMAGLLTRRETARDLRCSDRTIIRYEHAGMPVIRIGMLRLYDAKAVRDWLLTHQSRRDEPRRGRPTTKRAA